MVRRDVKQFFLYVFLLAFCGSCTLKVGPETLVAAKAKKHEICRVAVLPFVNETRKPEGSMLAYRIFLNELIASGLYEVEGEGEVRLFLARNKLLPRDLLDASLYADFARQLQVDAVIKGKVTEMDMKEIRGGGAVPYLALQVEMVEARTGRTVLNTYHRRRGDHYRTAMHFGMVRTISGLVARASQEIFDDWRRKGIGGCR